MKRNRLLYFSITSSILVLLFEFFQLKISGFLPDFFSLPLLILVFGFFIFITIVALISVFQTKRWQPIIIQFITILLLFLIPFNQFALNLDFKSNKSEREKVVRLVETGALKPNVYSNNSSPIQLPQQYKHLSCGGGEIMVNKSGNGYNILFFTQRGILDNFSGFIYTVNGQKPSKRDLNEDLKDVQKMGKNWYFVGSY